MIIVRIYEGLGNQLFQYAYAKALSLKSGQTVLLDVRETGAKKGEARLTPRKYSLNHFRISLPVCKNVSHFYPYLNENNYILDFMQSLSLKGCLPFKFYRENAPDHYDEKLMKIKGNWYLQGWFQDNRYFQEYEKIIKEEFTPRNRIKISKELENILHKQNTISIHIRRSDYKKTLNVLPVKYYENAMERIKNMIKSPFWIVFSDEINWVKENIDFGENCYFVNEKEVLQDYEELLIMSCCKNHIIANSTYSWWGAWLGKNKNKVVIAPDRWILKKADSNGRKIWPEGWIKESIR